jgi:hypothetical protein
MFPFSAARCSLEGASQILHLQRAICPEKKSFRPLGTILKIARSGWVRLPTECPK